MESKRIAKAFREAAAAYRRGAACAFPIMNQAGSPPDVAAWLESLAADYAEGTAPLIENDGVAMRAIARALFNKQELTSQPPLLDMLAEIEGLQYMEDTCTKLRSNSQVKALTAAQGKPERGWHEFLRLCVDAETDTLFFCVSEGEELYVIDSTRIRDLFQLVKKYVPASAATSLDETSDS